MRTRISKLFGLSVALAGLLLFSDAQNRIVTAQNQGVLWINDRGKGIYQLSPDGGKLQLLIPQQKLAAEIADIAVDAQGQIFFLAGGGDQARILKATPAGEVSTVLNKLSLFNPFAMAVDGQGNFIVIHYDARSGRNTLSRVDAKGEATEVALLCSYISGGFPPASAIAVDKDGNYIAAVSCPTPQLLRITPAGEVTTILDNPPFPNSLNAANVIWDIILAPSGQGYYVAGPDIFHISATGEFTPLLEGWPAIAMNALTVGPSGDLFAVNRFNNEVIRFYPDGARKVLFRSTTFVYPAGIEWIAQGSAP